MNSNPVRSSTTFTRGHLDQKCFEVSLLCRHASVYLASLFLVSFLCSCLAHPTAMGSLFSKNQRPPPPPDPQHRGDHRPTKRRRIDNRANRTVPPPTRAMLEVATASEAVVPGVAASAVVPTHSSQVANSINADAATSNAPSSVVPSAPPQKRRFPKRKYALFVGYVGENYFGMQINPGVITIEQLLLTALHRSELITESTSLSLPRIGWMRAARTDKGVSAAAQCVSVKLQIPQGSLSDAVTTINRHLPQDVQVFGLLRATNSFNGRHNCLRRRYEYIFPLPLLGPAAGVDENGRDVRIVRFTDILRRYEGSHDFANFTDGMAAGDPSARRVMMSVCCKDPFHPPGSGVPYVVVEIFGQSFLLHQIRKMVGLALTIYHGHAPIETLPLALYAHVKIMTPMAPALGLLLDTLYFDMYNDKFAEQLGGKISDEHFEEEKQRFKAERIYRRIAERERMDRTLESWVQNFKNRSAYKREEILELHKKFVLTNVGAAEMRKARIATYYPIRTTMEEFLDTSRQEMLNLANRLHSEFKRSYGVDASFLARAPGRVVLIGEHLDYNGLPVVGVALSQGAMIAGCLENVPEIELRHLENDKYAEGFLSAEKGSLLAKRPEKNTKRKGGTELNGEAGEHTLNGSDALEGNTYGSGKQSVEVPPSAANGVANGTNAGSSTAPIADHRDKRWLHYVSGGVSALIGALEAKRTVTGGGRVLVAGDLPRGGGLASSSSLVCAATVMAARMNRKRFPKPELASLAAKGERSAVGTNGGCVDHAISMCAVRDSASVVSFTPRFTVTDVALPKTARLFAVGSGIQAEKGGDDRIRDAFNLRAAECRIAAALLAKRLDVHLSRSVTTPGQLLFQAGKTGRLKCNNMTTLRRLAAGVMRGDEAVTAEQARMEIDVNEVEFRNRFLVGAEAAKFAVGRRMIHVFGETERVQEMIDLLKNKDVLDAEKIERMGHILNDGMESLRENYETSCKEVDELVAFCRAAGATGCRMTGAGWGGYTVSVVPEARAEEFLAKVMQRVGAERVVPVEPSSGVSIFAIYSCYSAPSGRGQKADGTKGESQPMPKEEKPEGVGQNESTGKEVAVEQFK